MHSDRRAPRAGRRQPADRIVGAILALAEGQAAIIRHKETSWASITFAGTRHQMELIFEGAVATDAGERFIALLPEHEFAIPGQLVADAVICAVDHQLAPNPRMQVSIELLLLEDA